MRITLKRERDGRTPQTALPAAQIKLIYMHYEERPTFVVDAANGVYRQEYCIMWQLDAPNPVYIPTRRTPFREASPPREWCCTEITGVV